MPRAMPQSSGSGCDRGGGGRKKAAWMSAAAPLCGEGMSVEAKAVLARQWLKERRTDLQVHLLQYDLIDPQKQAEIEQATQKADIGVCAADNEAAKHHFDALMRRFGKPWTLGEVLSGGIGGFVHWFAAGGACYGCVASHLQRSVTVDKPQTPDYSQPNGTVAETTIPASKAAIQAIASRSSGSSAVSSCGVATRAPISA